MQYDLIASAEADDSLWPIFEASFQRFLGDKCRQEFVHARSQSESISVLSSGGEVIGFCFHRVVPGELGRTGYLHDAPADFLTMIQGKKKYLSMEWLAVHPNHLGKFTKVQPVDLLLGCALRMMNESTYDGAIGFSRQDIRTDRMTERFGSVKMGEVQRFGLACSLVFMWRGGLKPHPISLTQNRIESLWQDWAFRKAGTIIRKVA